MIFEGHYNGESNGEFRLRRGPIFRDNERICVFDVEQVLIMQKRNYIDGKRVKDKYSLHNEAKEVVEFALNDFDRVVLWSTSPYALGVGGFEHKSKAHEELGNFPFSEVHQRIAGSTSLGDEGIVKFLGMLSNDWRNIVAIEDNDVFFDPVNIVVPYVNGSLKSTYFDARDIVFAGNGKNVF